jgi:hypothetical protein
MGWKDMKIAYFEDAEAGQLVRELTHTGSRSRIYQLSKKNATI